MGGTPTGAPGMVMILATGIVIRAHGQGTAPPDSLSLSVAESRRTYSHFHILFLTR